MKKYLLLLLIAFNVLAANASMTTKDVKRKDVIYTLVTVTEGSSWATVRTRGVSDGRENKITRYAVVKSSDLNAVGSIEIKDSIMDDGSSFNVIAISSHAFEDALVRYVSISSRLSANMTFSCAVTLFSWVPPSMMPPPTPPV